MSPDMKNTDLCTKRTIVKLHKLFCKFYMIGSCLSRSKKKHKANLCMNRTTKKLFHLHSQHSLIGEKKLSTFSLSQKLNEWMCLETTNLDNSAYLKNEKWNQCQWQLVEPSSHMWHLATLRWILPSLKDYLIGSFTLIY